MGHSLALPGVFGTVPSVEQATPDRNEGIIVLALQESVTVAINQWDSVRICDTDVVWLKTNKLAILLVCFVDSEEAFALTALPQEPEVRPRGGEGCRDVANLPVAEVREQVVEDRKEEDRVRRQEECHDRHDGRWSMERTSGQAIEQAI